MEDMLTMTYTATLCAVLEGVLGGLPALVVRLAMGALATAVGAAAALPALSTALGL